MKNYLLTYDLRGGTDYQYIHDAIKSLGPWWHYLESTWIIKSEQSSTDLFNRILPVLKGNEYILIVEIVPGTRFGLLPKDAWDWIDNPG